MDLLTALKVMARHWVIVLVAMIVTAPVARAIGDEIDPVYEAKASLLLLSPAKTFNAEGKPIEVNPFTRTGNAERVTATAVLAVTNTSQWEDRMEAAGATGDYEYELASEIIVDATVRDETSAKALNTLSVAVRLLEEELAERQRRAGAPPDTWISVDALAVPDEATVLLGSRIRATAGVAVLGAAVAASLAFLAEALGIGGGARRRRRRRREGRKGDSPDPSSAEPAPVRPPAPAALGSNIAGNGSGRRPRDPADVGDGEARPPGSAGPPEPRAEAQKPTQLREGEQRA